ncbi:dihydrofolate reductase family protein [Phenylobacterium sp.]|uniref:RibD family protein n=1 Tax=Phenylobacterium sp. TaxID=1871053 RepID=UPI002732096C|nr:dihydrofolate reductase family protein [Phenylobacterium sp.]MDP1600397.1 dihydrofolate reductase family protein [Phenylobacterium sp.]MDP3594792.1 dihydrofolate reductase family protein [Phenylobacterium sp.]
MVKITTLSELTIDGKLSLGPGASSKDLFGFYGDDLRAWFHGQRAAHDAIMVGAGTVRSDDPELTVRHAAGANPLRVIPCSLGDLPSDCGLLRDGVATLIAVSRKASPEIIAALEARAHVEVIVCGEDQVDLSALMAALEARGVRSLIVEGGSRLLHALHALGLVSRIIIKQIPIIAGAEDAPTYLRASPSGPALSLSRWRLEELFVLSGVAISIYSPFEAAA